MTKKFPGSFLGYQQPDPMGNDINFYTVTITRNWLCIHLDIQR
jgi:hypothetical protein